jgi:hypothetical protein
LWKKSLNLFACFIAFADKEKPKWQLKGAMICAVLSAVYDYETDWVRIEDTKNSIYLKMLHDYTPDSSMYIEARNLFITDWSGKLSEHGLERGSVALEFYHSVISSYWMSKYEDKDIASCGRLLQIVDDLLDLKEDEEKGDTNCFLTEDKDQYLPEAKAFLKSEFFSSLKKGFPVYYLIEFECLRVINKQNGVYPKNTK